SRRTSPERPCCTARSAPSSASCWSCAWRPPCSCTRRSSRRSWPSAGPRPPPGRPFPGAVSSSAGMGDRRRAFGTVMTDPNLRRVELAFLGFNMTEFATWIAILVYAFEAGGAGTTGIVAVILLVPSAIVAPFAAYSGDRFRRDRVLQVDYLLQGVAI